MDRGADGDAGAHGALDKPHDFVCSERVESACGLIQVENVGVCDERDGDIDSLCLWGGGSSHHPVDFCDLPTAPEEQFPTPEAVLVA